MEEDEKKNKKDLFLLVLESIRKDGRLPDLGIKKDHREYYVNLLKKQGLIRRIGYGVWEVDERRIKPLGVTTHHYPSLIDSPVEAEVRSDDVRVHNLVFKVRFVSPLSWESRLNVRDIHFIRLGSGVLRIIHDGRKVWLCKDRLIIYNPSGLDYTHRKASGGLLLAVKDFMGFVRSLQALLGLGLSQEQGLVWSINRKDLALVKDAIAQDYNSRKEKLRVYDAKGLWLIADDSFGLGELDFVRNQTNHDEINVVQAFLNDLKAHPVKLSDMTSLHASMTMNMIQVQKAVADLVKVIEMLKEGR